MKYNIHTYTSQEPMLKVNAFIVEAEEELVIVDTTLTRSDSLALKEKAKELDKPIAGILITHGHPDHIAGIANIAPNGEIPIYALASVKKLMEDTEEMKHKQWSGMFGPEWIPKWIYPNSIVKHEQVIKIAGLFFQVLDLGSGGDCDANSIWLLTDDKKHAFVGDFIYHQNHTYMADGSILRWLANLEKYKQLLSGYESLHVGHGPSCNASAIQKQTEYFITYCSNVLKATNGTGIFTEESRKQFETEMFGLYPDYGCQFMVSLAADVVGKELASHSVKG
jgi:glyoxylase-like metal-dependent hydrolase (beta-lactamase superfamily II)